MAELNTIARPYSKAAFDFALEQKDLVNWSNSLTLLCEIIHVEEIQRLISNPQITSGNKSTVIVEAANEVNAMSEAVMNFCHVLAENKRLALLPKISEQFEQLKAQHEKVIDVDLTTAYDLDKSLIQKLTSALSSKLGREVRLATTTDKHILGGVVLRANDFVIDGSIRAKLTKLAESMNS